MVKIKTTIDFNSNCILSVDEATGFKSTENPFGFTLAADAATGDNYHITDGYFIDVIISHKYKCDPVVIPVTLVPELIISPSLTYVDNFNTVSYKLPKDGVYSFKRMFIISKNLYEYRQGGFGGKQVIYYDSAVAKYYIVSDNNEISEIGFNDVALLYSSSQSGAVGTSKFVSTCYLNRCLYLLQKEVIEKNVVCYTKSYDDVLAKRDFIDMTISVIKYLKDDNYLTEIQRLLEAVNTCGLICKSVGTKNKQDCGCNG